MDRRPSKLIYLLGIVTAFLALSRGAFGQASAAFVAQDPSTQGNWIGAYGGDGYSIPNSSQSLPSYASFSVSGDSTYTWAASTSDVRALQNPGGSGRMASLWYNAPSFTFDVNMTDGNTHQVALYALDWDDYEGGRAEQIQVLDAVSGAVLNTENVSGFQNGQYLVWNISGHVHIVVTTTNGSSNAAISGVFFEPAPSGGNQASASFVKTDTTTQGNWIGAYGGDGYSIPNSSQSLPSYASFSVSGDSTYTWAASTSDVRALQNPGGSGRMASLWYNAPSFTFDVNMTDGNTHQVALYALDWDDYEGGRAEQIQVLDAVSGAVLNTENVSGFQNGQYLVWNISGHVHIVVTTTNGSSNAAISGVFFEPASSGGNQASASFVKTDTTTQGNWIGAYGGDGYSIPNSSQSLPSYASFSVSGDSTYTWAASTSDVRALQNPGGSGRMASLWYNAPSFTFDVNMTDGNTHQVALYALDWDDYEGGRAEQIQVLDAVSGAVLNTENVSGFQNGQYLVWNISGHVHIVVTTTNGSSNAAISGVFFEPASGGGSQSGVGVVQKQIVRFQGPSSVFPGPVTAGNLIVTAALCESCSPGAQSVSDTLGSTWHLVSNSSFTGYYTVWWAIAPVSGADTVTVNSSANAVYWDIALAELSGVTAPDQSQMTVQSNVNNASSGFITTSEASEVMLGIFIENGSPEAASAGGGWTMVADPQYQFDLEYQVTSSIANYAATANYTTAPTVQSHIITFMPTPQFFTSGISPSSALPTQSVTIKGTGFGGVMGSSTVTFNGLPATVMSWGESSIVAKVPSSITPGSASVVVTVNGTASNAQTLTVVSGPGVIQTQVVNILASNTTTFSNPVTAGNMVVAAVLCASCWNGTLTISDTLGSTWHLAATPSDASGPYSVWWTIAPSSGTDTVTVNSTVSAVYWDIALAEVYGVTTFDQSQFATGSGNSANSGSSTTSQPNEVLFGIIQNRTTSEMATAQSRWIMAPMTAEVPGEYTFQMESQSVSSIGNYAATASYTTNPTWTALLLTFMSPGSGGGGPITVTVSPSTSTVTELGNEQFTATVTGTSNQSVTWSISPASGSISPNGLYTAPATISSTQTVTVTALSNQDGVTFGTATITLTPPTGPPIISYYIEDQLGTSRVIVTSSGTICYDADYYPFGGERSVIDSCPQNYKFTGKERDAESNLDNFGARYNSSQMGRFMSPDPAGMMAVDIGSPQTLNRYSYVLNNPLSFTDPFGLDCEYLNSSGTGIENGGIDQNSSSGECGKKGGYWVNGTITQVNIDSNATTISLTGTTNGNDQTNASYQQNTTISVGQYYDTFFNPAGHVAFGVGNGPRYGLNPQSDWQFMKYAISRRLSGHVGGGPGVPGSVKVQVGGSLVGIARVPATGMQAQMVLNGIMRGIQNPPNYDVGGGPATCDCASWPQQVLGDAGINVGRPTQDPGTLINQLNNLYPQQQ